jgi:SAM-dependent methyltransferase
MRKTSAKIVNMKLFDEMGIYWKEISDQNSTERQIKFIENTLKTEGLVLDLACGTGRHLIPLSKEGYSMVGLDLSLNLLRIAKNRSSGIQLVRGDMRFLPFKSEEFSSVISMDTSFGYLPSEQDDLKSLNEVNRILKQEGILIIDLFNRERLILKNRQNRFSRIEWAFLPALLKPNRIARWMLFQFFKWKEYPSFFLLQKRTVDATGERLHDLWVVSDKTNGQIKVFEHIAHLYKFKHLKGLLENAGITIKQVYGDYERQSFSTNSNRLILVTNMK